MTTHAHPTEPRPASGCQGCGGHRSPRPAGGCGCGCDSTETCPLECLERPLFSAGMVLSDSDLTALVDWTSGRFGLQRLRHGWGVACGLDVRCDKDSPGRVVVEPGYAVGCCGEDVVLCEPQTVDLTGCCRVEAPCGEPSPVEEGGSEKTADDVRDGAGACGDAVVDIVLEPTQTPAATGLVSGCGCRCGCGSGAGCGHRGGDEAHDCGDSGRPGDGCGGRQVVSTRARDGGRAYAVKVSLREGDPRTFAAKRALEQYAACHRVVEGYVRWAQAWRKDGGPSRDEIVGWLRRQDIDPPCDWWTTLCADLDRADGDAMMDAAVARALLDLVADCRHRWRRRRCPGCEGDVVGLARVWLRRSKDDAGESCVVTHVDAYPPYRRELATTSDHVPAGAEDLAPFVWQRWDEVCSAWRRLAPGSIPTMVEVTGTYELLVLLAQTVQLWWGCEDPAPTPVVVDTACLGKRVLGFRPAGRDDWFLASDSGFLAPAPASPPLPPPPGGIREGFDRSGVAPPAADAAAGPAVAAAAAPDAVTPTEAVGDASAEDAEALNGAADAVTEDTGADVGAPSAGDQPAAPVVHDLRSLKGVGRVTAERLLAGKIATVEELSLFDPMELAVLLGNARVARAIHDEAVRAVREGR